MLDLFGCLENISNNDEEIIKQKVVQKVIGDDFGIICEELDSKCDRDTLKGQCQLQCIARSNNAWRPFYWQSNSCLGFQSVIHFNHPMVILAHFNRIVTTKHQRNVYNRYLLTFHHFQGKM